MATITRTTATVTRTMATVMRTTATVTRTTVAEQGTVLRALGQLRHLRSRSLQPERNSASSLLETQVLARVPC
ncbi:hypothetical protein DIPPA_11687 [Diplonema papillatum]|nr:hypothetical protein DIPPA_11687 [Diplonema papillatum]